MSLLFRCPLGSNPFKWMRSMPTRLHWNLYDATMGGNILSALSLLFSAFLVSGLHMELIVYKNGPNFLPLSVLTAFVMWLWNSSHQEMEFTPSPLNLDWLCDLLCSRNDNLPNSSLSLKRSCSLLLTPGTPQLLWEQPSGRWETTWSRAELSQLKPPQTS